MLNYVYGIIVSALGISFIYTTININTLICHIKMTKCIGNAKEFAAEFAKACAKTMVKSLLISGITITGLILVIWGCNIIVWNLYAH